MDINKGMEEFIKAEKLKDSELTTLEINRLKLGFVGGAKFILEEERRKLHGEHLN
jgi:hypothetical protein